jgi:acyl-CoA thioester hydrolase
VAPVIEASGLIKRYGKTTALDGLDLAAESGQVLAVLGAGGAGKNTFVRAAATLLRLNGGRLAVAGHDAGREPRAVRPMIGLRSAGVGHAGLRACGAGPVSLEERIRFHAEVVPGDEPGVSCKFAWGGGKTFRVVQQVRRSDGSLIAEVTHMGGLLGLKQPRPAPGPAAFWRSVAAAPAALGLQPTE